MKESWVTCGSCARLTCSILVYRSTQISGWSAWNWWIHNNLPKTLLQWNATFHSVLWWFCVRTVSDMKEYWLTCGSHARLTCSILVYRSTQISDWSAWNMTIHNNLPKTVFQWNATLHAVLCSCMWTVHIIVCAVGLEWHKMNRKCPEQLAHNRFWEKQSFHRLLFLCLFGVFPPWYECICDRFHCKQSFNSCVGIF